MNGLNAAGNKVASFMNSQEAFSASFSQLFFFQSNLLLRLCPRGTFLSLRSLFPIWLDPLLLQQYFAVWACVSRVHCHYCTPEVLLVLWVKPYTIILTDRWEKENGKTIKTQSHENSSRLDHSPSVPPYRWCSCTKWTCSLLEERLKTKTSTHKGDLYGTLERNVQTFKINVHFKLSTVFHWETTMLCLVFA